MPVLPEWIGPEMPAVYIAQVASHFFKPGMGLWAAHAAVFPVSTALCHFARTGRRDSPAVSAMVDAFATSKTGIIMRDFLEAIGLSGEGFRMSASLGGFQRRVDLPFI
ncbi:hypothetical protein D6C85_06513 [Aureobasidium pullulans]|uniref:Uncharacterized protein n=1 Tax=Aureobasidium pullulans TaxID=5580 RepID=A0A4S9WVF6_AURPU|nr:hypothetical protein D6C85_06513 [Aureobasidium pullulans]